MREPQPQGPALAVADRRQGGGRLRRVGGLGDGQDIAVGVRVIDADQLAREADFFSIGTNALTQYTLAMDRMHPQLARQTDAMHPAVLRLIGLTVDAAQRHGKWVGVCGGAAGDDVGALVLTGLVLAAAGTALTGLATSLYSIATAYALASLGFGFTRPGFTAGSSLAVGADAQGSVAGKVTSINGASFVLGPSIGVGLYEAQHSLPYLTAGAACIALFAYCLLSLPRQAAD